jgi:superfamily II DNA or RNA helicase
LASSDFDFPKVFLLKQLSYQFPLQNSGGELSNSRTQLLPHQILLTHKIVNESRRHLLIADEVGLGKTIEAGMVIRELMARKEAERILIICPAGLTKNWQQELQDCFRLEFEILGRDFIDDRPSSWERHSLVLASIDAVKRTNRMGKLLEGPRWDVIVFDEAHHLTRKRYGKKVESTQNYRLAENLRSRTRDLLFLTATPHQGDGFQFWCLINLLDDQLFESSEAMLDHKGLLNRVMIRRTKREVTDAKGESIFMRRQVHSQIFNLSVQERAFYEKLTDYLKEGYSVAGVGQSKTTSQQRAIGFVMATFQKMMSSSPRAIRKALRRRLLVILAREQMRLESRMVSSKKSEDLAPRILSLQEEMHHLAIDLFRISSSPTQRTEADAFIANLKQQLAKKKAAEEEITEWTLDSEEEGEQAIYAETNIPDEPKKVKELIQLVPEGVDRKFNTFIRAVEQIRREHPQEKFLIFTQYRETQEFLKEEMAKLYGLNKIAIIKGGPLEEKIAAVESFWDPNGAQFLISTSAGGEGINLQVCHILFNYDLPWNPMAVEQRIGRIHRYGQFDTSQIYNLVAEDTVEERIYGLLERKLIEIAKTIGKVDEITGDVLEDFRSEILGFLGSSPNYQELYKKALIDRDYKRTEKELSEALEKARQASEALRSLAQGLETFNVQHYRELQGKFSMEDLQKFVETGILALEGSFLPNGEGFRIETPKVLKEFSGVIARYPSTTFDRNLAMRRRGMEFLGLGHPLVDALIRYFQSPIWKGAVSDLRDSDKKPGMAAVRYLVTAQMENGHAKQFYQNFLIDLSESSCHVPEERFDLDLMDHIGRKTSPTGEITELNTQSIKQIAENSLRDYQASLRAKLDGILSLRSELIGLGIY